MKLNIWTSLTLILLTININLVFGSSELIITNKNIKAEINTDAHINFKCNRDQQTRVCHVFIGLKSSPTVNPTDIIGFVEAFDNIQVNYSIEKLNDTIRVKFPSLVGRLDTTVTESGEFRVTIRNVGISDDMVFFFKTTFYSFSNDIISTVNDEVSITTNAGPFIRKYPASEITVDENQSETISLTVFGKPEPQVNWQLDSHSLISHSQESTGNSYEYKHTFTIHRIPGKICGRMVSYSVLGNGKEEKGETKLIINVSPQKVVVKTALYNATSYMFSWIPINFGLCNSSYEVELSDDKQSTFDRSTDDTSMIINKDEVAINATRLRIKSILLGKESEFSELINIQKYTVPTTTETTTQCVSCTPYTKKDDDDDIGMIIGIIICGIVVILIIIMVAYLYKRKQKRCQNEQQQKSEFSFYSKTPPLERSVQPNPYSKDPHHREREQIEKIQIEEYNKTPPSSEYQEIHDDEGLESVSAEDIKDEIDNHAYLEIDDHLDNKKHNKHKNKIDNTTKDIYFSFGQNDEKQIKDLPLTRVPSTNHYSVEPQSPTRPSYMAPSSPARPISNRDNYDKVEVTEEAEKEIKSHTYLDLVDEDLDIENQHFEDQNISEEES